MTQGQGMTAKVKKIIPKEIGLTSTELSNKIPLRGGLYLSKDFRNAKYPIRDRATFFGVVSAGDTLCYNSEKIMKNIFQEITVLESMRITSESKSQEYDVIITPEVVKLDYQLITTIPVRCLVETVIKWNIASPEGKEIFISTIRSDEVKISGPKEERCIKPSLENNFRKAQEDIYSSGWWIKQWWKNSN
jgi:hypothetical protein